MSQIYSFCDSFPSCVGESCHTSCHPMDGSMPSFPVLRICWNSCPWVGDAIQTSFPLSPSSLLALNILQHQSLFHIMWPKYWSFSFSISLSSEYSGLIPLGLTGLISFLSKGLSRVFSSTTVQKHQFFDAQPSLWSNSHIRTWLLEKS